MVYVCKNICSSRDTLAASGQSKYILENEEEWLVLEKGFINEYVSMIKKCGRLHGCAMNFKLGDWKILPL